MTATPLFREGTAQDGTWHATQSFSTRPIKVSTWGRNGPGTQHHRGAHATVQRWTGTRWEYKHCGCIHKKRSTTFACAKRMANRLNRKAATDEARREHLANCTVCVHGLVPCPEADALGIEFDLPS